MSGVLIDRSRDLLTDTSPALLDPSGQLDLSSGRVRSCSVLDLFEGVKLLSLMILADLLNSVLTLFLSIDPLALCSGFRVGVSGGSLSSLATVGASWAPDGGLLEYSLRLPVDGE